MLQNKFSALWLRLFHPVGLASRDGSPSDCTTTTCGDGMLKGAETCDDGNTGPLDGCSETCQAEPECTEGACTLDCGDGLIIDEHATTLTPSTRAARSTR